MFKPHDRRGDENMAPGTPSIQTRAKPRVGRIGADRSHVPVPVYPRRYDVVGKSSRGSVLVPPSPPITDAHGPPFRVLTVGYIFADTEKMP